MTQTIKFILSCAALALLAACGDIAEQTPLESQIVGGSEARPGAYPFIARLDYLGKFHCSGALIERTWVLTAAHCVEGRSAERFKVILGDHEVGVGEGVEQAIRVRQIAIAPNYDDFSLDDDLALLRLAQPAKLNARVSTVERTSLPSANTTLRVIGWGATREGGSTSRALRQLDVPVVSSSMCQRAFPGEITSSMFCAGFSEGGKDSCQGDSGGPIFKGNRLVGVVSWGVGCARPDTYGVYTNVGRFDNWIGRVTN